MKIFQTRSFCLSFLAFLILNLALYLFIFFFHRPEGLLKSLSVFDAGWYLQIAKVGYGSRMSYGFFPFYPLTIRLVSFLTGDIGTAAFVLTNVLLLANFCSLHYILTKLFSEKLALKVNLLFWTFPVGIIFRSFFTENLYLFFLIWFSYALIRQRFLASALILGLMNVTKGNGFLLIFLLLFQMKQMKRRSKILAFTFAGLPLLIWSLFCFTQTGSFLYFLTARSTWGPTFFPFLTAFYSVVISPWETAFLFVFAYLLYSVRNLGSAILKKVCWFLLLAPLGVFTMSFARSQIISFPLFVYPAQRFQGRVFILVVFAETVCLFAASLYFVNWSFII
jgi:hypothetical protein